MDNDQQRELCKKFSTQIYDTVVKEQYPDVIVVNTLVSFLMAACVGQKHFDEAVQDIITKFLTLAKEGRELRKNMTENQFDSFIKGDSDASPKV